ncbi:MAG: hypothetical protein ACOC95_10035 [Planctomycetota bacterium]
MVGVLLTTALTGCGGSILRGGGGGPDHLTLWATPLAEDADGRLGTDGISVRLIFYDLAPGGKAEAVGVRRGVDLVMYEGGLQGRTLAEVEPFHVWQLSAEQLAAFRGSYYGLRCYALTLYWPDRRPEANTVTLVARYENEAGRLLKSAPAVIKVH